MERERSKNELRMQVAKKRRELMFALETKNKAALLEPANTRRGGRIVNGGLGVSKSIVSCPDLLYR